MSAAGGMAAASGMSPALDGHALFDDPSMAATTRQSHVPTSPDPTGSWWTPRRPIWYNGFGPRRRRGRHVPQFCPRGRVVPEDSAEVSGGTTGQVENLGTPALMSESPGFERTGGGLMRRAIQTLVYWRVPAAGRPAAGWMRPTTCISTTPAETSASSWPGTAARLHPRRCATRTLPLGRRGRGLQQTRCVPARRRVCRHQPTALLVFTLLRVLCLNVFLAFAGAIPHLRHAAPPADCTSPAW